MVVDRSLEAKAQVIAIAIHNVKTNGGLINIT